MTVIIIRLVGEKDDRLFKGIQVDNEILYVDLQKKIQIVTSVPNDFQQIQFRGEDLPVVERPLQDIKFGEEIVVRHSNLGRWEAYVNRVNEFKNAQVSDTKKQAAESAQSLYALLRESSFFTAYDKFDIEVTKHHKPISKYLDKRTHWIRSAATNFFTLSMFKGQNPVVEFEDTCDGTRSAVICKISVNSIIHKYRIKTNHNARDSSQVDSTEVSQAIVQIHFLAVFLSLGDMHEENFGLNGSSDPLIVDFMMSNYGVPKNKFLHESSIIRSIRARDILDNCDSATRLQIAKKAIQRWNFEDKLGEVLKLMDKEKADFARETLDFDKKTKDLEEFVEKVKSNIQDLFKLNN